MRPRKPSFSSHTRSLPPVLSLTHAQSFEGSLATRHFVSPLESALTRCDALSSLESALTQNGRVSYPCATKIAYSPLTLIPFLITVFRTLCTSENLNCFLFKRFRSFPKTPGVGVSSNVQPSLGSPSRAREARTILSRNPSESSL